MACSSACPTPGAHQTYGECLRAKSIQIDRHALIYGTNVERDKDRRLSRYEDARNQGLQPKNTTWKHVRDAFENGGVAHTPVTVQNPVTAPAED